MRTLLVSDDLTADLIPATGGNRHADIVIMDDDIRKIPATVRLARKTMHIVRQNIVFALVAVKHHT